MTRKGENLKLLVNVLWSTWKNPDTLVSTVSLDPFTIAKRNIHTALLAGVSVFLITSGLFSHMRWPYCCDIHVLKDIKTEKKNESDIMSRLL